MGYTKLFQEILASSLWDQDDTTRLVWITVLALKDRKHFVRGTPTYLARMARVPVTACERALSILENPDSSSNSQVDEGRRLRVAAGGWFVVNGEYYQKKLSKEERATYKAEKMREYRSREKEEARAATDGYAEVHGEHTRNGDAPVEGDST